MSELELLTRVGDRTWLARTDDEALVVARCVADVGEDEDSRVPEVVAPLTARAQELTALRSATLVPVLGLGYHAGALCVLSEPDPGVSLHRLIQVAILSPEQAAILLGDVLRALTALHAAGYGHGQVHAGNVHVGPTGQARLGDWAGTALDPSASLEEVRRQDVAAAVALSRQLHKSARAGREHRLPSDARLLEALEHAGADLSGRTGSVPPPLMLGDVAAGLDAAIGAVPDRAAIREQLSELVGATPPSGRFDQAGGWPRTEQVPGTAAAPNNTGSPAGRQPMRLARRYWGGGRVWWTVAVLLVLGIIAGVQWALAGDQITANLRQLFGGSSAAEPTTSPTPIARPAPPPGPGGPITGISIRALDACEPGAVCPVRVLVEVRPVAEPLRVDWSYEIVDRCTRERTTWPGGAAVVVPGADRMLRVDQVQLPESSSLEVYAVTSEPVRVSGGPLEVPPEGGAC